MTAVDLSKEEARYLLDCVAYFRDSPAYRVRYEGMTYTLSRKLAPIANGPDDDGEGGVSVPAGDSPDSPAPGEARLPGGSDDYVSAASATDLARRVERGYRDFGEAEGRFVKWNPSLL